MKVRGINLQSSSKKIFFLIHGYTGSPDDFNNLPEYLFNKGVDVKVMLLHGHGTNVKNLDPFELEDFLVQVENKFRKVLGKYEEIILGGVSFGGQIAMYLAAKYTVQGVFSVGLPYKLKFPFNIPGSSGIRFLKKYWPKFAPKSRSGGQRNAFYYKQMHIKGIKIVKQANRLLKDKLQDITCPVLTIYSKKDRIGNYKTVKILNEKIKTTHHKKIFDNRRHNVFFTNNEKEIYKRIGDFFKITKSKTIKRDSKISAIVPAYNEADNIGRVLDVLSKTEVLDEIIVVDDGSSDNTSAIADKFEKVKVLKNKKNKGKAYSMQRAVDFTDAEVLFFCDADLKGLTPNIVWRIIEPVAVFRYNMYIGVRNNIMQKALTLFALNSGERALRREVWNRLPEKFKYRYRIEAGLNFIAKSYGNGYGWEKFDYYQTVKEKKYGIIKGTLLRWWMNFDVFYAYCFGLIQSFIHKNNL